MIVSLSAAAQQAAPAAPGAASSPAAGNAQATSLETVVVTSRKKREKLSEVPLAITAITAQTLQDAGTRNLQDVANLTTGLTISAAGAEAQLAPTIRGLTNLNGGSGDPNVSVFLDGIYLANNSAISLGLIAVERVEVVKGPVSALYGRNAFAGAINYISKKPPESWGWLVRGDYRHESSRMVQNANFAYIPARNVLNLRAAIENDTYRLTFFVANLTNDATPEGVAQNVRLNDFTGPYAGALPAKRTFGLIGNVMF